MRCHYRVTSPSKLITPNTVLNILRTIEQDIYCQNVESSLLFKPLQVLKSATVRCMLTHFCDVLKSDDYQIYLKSMIEEEEERELCHMECIGNSFVNFLLEMGMTEIMQSSFFYPQSSPSK